jgi:hypothetical protein
MTEQQYRQGLERVRSIAARSGTDINAMNRILDAVDEALAQPAPSAEQTCGVCGRQYPADDERDTCHVCWPGFGEHGQRPTPSAEPTVQVPESLVEAAAHHLDREGYHGTATLLRDALSPQPTPREVEVEGSFFAVADLPNVLARHVRALDAAHRREKQHWLDCQEQPNVDPMTLPVGTTFSAVIEGGTQRSSFERVESIGGGFTLHEASTGHYWNPAALDPSTIRDVTPPPATPEEGDRG